MARIKQHRRRLKQRLRYRTRPGKCKGKGKNSRTSHTLKPLHKHTSHLNKKGIAVK